MVVVPDRSKNTLMPIITQYIRPGTTVMSDEWRSYNDIGISGYTHQTFSELRESYYRSPHKWSGGFLELHEENDVEARSDVHFQRSLPNLLVGVSVEEEIWG